MVATANHKSPLAAVLRSGAAAWRPEIHPPTPDWCAAELRLPSDTSADPGPFDLTGRPYWREPLALLDDPDVLQISIVGDAQGGKTVLITAALLSRSKLAPAPAMLAGPDQDAMRELRDKVYGMAEASPALAPHIPPRRLWNDRFLDFGSMLCYLAYSGSSQRLRGRTCKYVLMTEVDVWQDSPRLGQSARLVKARVKAFSEYKILAESTPTDDASTIWALFLQGDQRKFHVPCPHCGHYQELRFFPHKSGKYAGCGGVAGLQGKAGQWLSPEEARRAAYYVCERGCRIESLDKHDMVARGVWCPKGCRVNHRGRLDLAPARSKRHASYQISALYAEHNGFGDVAAAYLEAREAGALREFWNNWLGLPYRGTSSLPNWKTLGRRLIAEHRSCTIPPGAWFVTAAADVQADRVYWEAVAWGDRASHWLIDWGILKRASGEDGRQEAAAGGSQAGLIATDLAQLDDAVLNVRWPIAAAQKNPRGLTSLGPRVLGIDAGFRIQDVHAYLRAHPGDRVRAIHGDDKVDPQQLYRMNVVEKNARTGKPYEGGLQLWGIYVAAYKRELVDRFGLSVDEPGSLRLPLDIFERGEDVLRQLVNETPVVETLASGRKVVRWVVRDKVLGEHFWDLHVYNRCLADMVTGSQWDAAKWPRAKEEGARMKDEAPPRRGDVAARDYLEDFSAR